MCPLPKCSHRPRRCRPHRFFWVGRLEGGACSSQAAELGICCTHPQTLEEACLQNSQACGQGQGAKKARQSAHRECTCLCATTHHTRPAHRVRDRPLSSTLIQALQLTQDLACSRSLPCRVRCCPPRKHAGLARAKKLTRDSNQTACVDARESPLCCHSALC